MLGVYLYDFQSQCQTPLLTRIPLVYKIRPSIELRLHSKQCVTALLAATSCPTIHALTGIIPKLYSSSLPHTRPLNPTSAIV